MPPPRAIAALVVAMLAVTVGGCRGPRGRAAALRPPEVLVEVLPRSARVELDGRAIGAGGGAVASRGADEHVLRVSADGYEPEERVFPAGSLEGARIAAALRPRGSGIARAIDYDDGLSLAAAAEWLAASGDPRDAAEYAERAIAVDPGIALAHRSLGDARSRAGDQEGALAAWAEYLRRAPGAADAAEVERRMEAVRRDVRIP